MRVHHVLLIVSSSMPAFAEPTASDTRESAMLYEFVPLRADQLGWRFRADALAAALATTDGKDRHEGGAGTVGAQLGLGATPDCDIVAAGGQLATRSDDRVVSAQQWASVCPLGGDGNLTFDHRLEWDVSPRLLAAPRLRPGVQRRETIGFNVFGSMRPLVDRGPLTTLPERDWQQGGTLRLEFQYGWADQAPTGELQPMMDVVLRNFRHDYGDDGPPLTIAAITGRLEALIVTREPKAPSVASLSGDLARVEGVRVGGVRLGGRLGGRLVPETDGMMRTYKQQLWVIGEGAASVERDLVHGVTTRLALERRGWPVWDGRFVVDDRATWSLFAHHDRLSGRVDVAAAAAHVLQIGEQHAVAMGGVTAEGQLELGAGFGLKLHSELGRSVYAPGATLDAPRWASETLLMLAAHVAHHPGASK
jgi:hypothetical protein